MGRKHENLPFTLGEHGCELFTLTPLRHGFGAFGLLDKYLSPLAVVSQQRVANGTRVKLCQAGDFDAWSDHSPISLRVNGRALGGSEYNYEGGLLRVPRETFQGPPGPL